MAAEWKPADLEAVTALANDGQLPLDDVITHREQFRAAADAYETAFEDPRCVKMILDWREVA